MGLRRTVFLVPCIIFGVLAAYFAIGLTKNPHELPSVLIDQPVDDFRLVPIQGRPNPDREWGLQTRDFKKEITLLNVFGSWCVACRIEHPFLMQLSARGDIPVHGIDWREPDRASGPAWLKRYGDPYTLIGDDPDSRGAIAFGVTGAPETFLIDQNGVIRYKHIGPLNEDVWDNVFRPLIQKLENQ